MASRYPRARQPQSTMRLLKTYIVEDSKIIRDSLIAALEEMAPIEVVGYAEDEPTAVAWLTAPDTVKPVDTPPPVPAAVAPEARTCRRTSWDT